MMFTQMKISSGPTPELFQCFGRWLGTDGETPMELLDDVIIKMITGRDTITATARKLVGMIYQAGNKRQLCKNVYSKL